MFAQHPHRSFNRIRRRDPWSLVPDYRFFAPEPSTQDFRFAYRTVDRAGRLGKWREIDTTERRRGYHGVWFPNRRPEKAVFDICNSILLTAARVDLADIHHTLPYQLAAAFTLSNILRESGVEEIKAFQFSIASVAEYDPEDVPDLSFVSPLIDPLSPWVATGQ
ncbi:hypothetical protein ACRAR1_20915 [Streptomyces sanyensis]|uniref:hypothetical protein n=1 Tax=Streptomyces sanyensis TaxID=568869 RepID=UPI003D77C66B